MMTFRACELQMNVTVLYISITTDALLGSVLDFCHLYYITQNQQPKV